MPGMEEREQVAEHHAKTRLVRSRHLTPMGRSRIASELEREGLERRIAMQVEPLDVSIICALLMDGLPDHEQQ